MASWYKLRFVDGPLVGWTFVWPGMDHPRRVYARIGHLIGNNDQLQVVDADKFDHDYPLESGEAHEQCMSGPALATEYRRTHVDFHHRIDIEDFRSGCNGVVEMREYKPLQSVA